MSKTPGATTFIPTKAQRDFVETCAVVGLAHDQIVLILPMEDDRPPISTDTLVAKFGDELTKGKARAIAKLGGECYRIAAGMEPTIVGKDRLPALFFYLKTQAGWRETDRHEHVFPGVSEADEEVGLARLAALLEKGRRKAEKPGPTTH